MQALARYRNLPIKHKLRLIIMSVVTAALAIASTAILAYDQLELRSEMRSDLSVLAEIFADDNTAALTFGDQEAAQLSLDNLRAKRHIVQAFMYDPKASCSQGTAASDTPKSSAVPQVAGESSWFENNRLKVFRDVRLNEQHLGSIYLESDFGELNARLAPIRLDHAGDSAGNIVAGAGAVLATAANYLRADRQYRPTWRKWCLCRRATAREPSKSPTTIWGNSSTPSMKCWPGIEHRDEELMRHRNRLEEEVDGAHGGTGGGARQGASRQ